MKSDFIKMDVTKNQLITDSILNCLNVKCSMSLFEIELKKRNYLIESTDYQIALFRILETIITNSIDTRELYIYTNKSKFLIHTVNKSNREVGVELNLSHERVRQLLNASEKRLKTRIKKYINQNKEIIRNTLYFKMNWNNIIVLNNDAVFKINELEKTNFSIDFITFVFSLIFSKHILISNNSNLRSKYFINKNIYYTNTYLKRFFKYFLNKDVRDEYNTNSDSAITSICETVISEEVNKYII